MNAKKMDHANQGIKCVVNTCYFYLNGDNCSADKIHVEPRNASQSADTDCGTFTPKGH